MATKKFKGFSLITTAQTPSDKDTLYFVRTNNGKTDGYLYFNGKKYGTAEDVKGALEKKYGDLMFDGSAVTISKYVEEQIKTVNTAATALAGRVNTLESTVGDASNGLVKKVADNATAIEKLNGDETAEGSVKKAVADAKSALVGAEDTADTIKHAEKLANDAKDAADVKLASIEGSKAIAVSEVTGEAGAKKQTVSLALDNSGNVKLSQSATGLKAEISLDAYGVKGVAEGDNVLAVDDNGILSSDVTLSYDSAAKKIYLHGKDKTAANAISEIDATAFVKDGMLKKAELLTDPDADHKGTFIVLTWNTDEADGADSDKTPMYIDVTTLIDVYQAKENGGLKLVDHTFEVDYDLVAKKADLNTVSGVANENKIAIEKINGNAATDGSIAKAVADAKTVLIGEGATAKTIAAVEQLVKAEESRAKGAETANTKAIQDLEAKIADGAVTLKIEDPYLTVGQTGSTYQISTKIQAVEGAGSSAKGLAEASDVKNYVDETVADKVAEKNVAATGDTYVSASADANKVTVTATQKLQDAVTTAESVVENGTITKANNAVKSVNGITGETVVVEDKDIAISAAISNQVKGTKINAVLADIYSKIGLVKVSSTDKTITVDETGRIVDVNTESVAKAQAAGHVALEHGDDGALYGVMYYSGDDTE